MEAQSPKSGGGVGGGQRSGRGGDMRPLPHFKGGRVIYICVTRIESWLDMCLRAVAMGALRRPVCDRLCHVSTGGHEL